MHKTFDYYRATNHRLAASNEQENLYQRYLQRVEDIVTKKPQPDLSTTFHMTSLNRFHHAARQHRSHQRLATISTHNQILLNKIVSAKKVKLHKHEQGFVPTLKGKWAQEDARINDENRKMASRVTHQKSCINTGQGWNVPKESPRRVTEKSFYDSRLKERKLPPLLEPAH